MNEEFKYCLRCKKVLPKSSFYKSNQSKDGLYCYCKECVKKYYNSEKGRISYEKYWKSEKKKLTDKKYYKSEKGQEVFKKAHDKYVNSGNCARHHQEKYQNNIDFKIKRLLRSRLNLALKNNQKSGHTLELLGCTIEHLKQHLESQFEPGMTWENYGTEWHIDHIIPCTYFDLTDPEQQRICFNCRNLQPMWGSENIKKSNKVPDDVEELVEFLKQEIFNI